MPQTRLVRSYFQYTKLDRIKHSLYELAASTQSQMASDGAQAHTQGASGHDCPDGRLPASP